MNILITIVHHWNPAANGSHGSLRPNLQNRQHALQDQLLAFRRLSTKQGALNISTRSVDDANTSLRHKITIKIVTDGIHTVLPYLEEEYQNIADEIAVSPSDPKHLGFEAHRILADNLDSDYDLYAYFEDDLLVHDPLFFHKIFWFQQSVGESCVLMPHRYEDFWKPSKTIDRFYIDGPMVHEELRYFIPEPPASISTYIPGGNVIFESPKNPHSGCFVLSRAQMLSWSKCPSFLDMDCSLISPLESAATLGLIKSFTLYKPHISFASFLSLQHWGTSFRELIGNQISI